MTKDTRSHLRSAPACGVPVRRPVAAAIFLPSVPPENYSNPTNGPIAISSAVISTTHTALMTSPAGSMSNIR